MLLALRAIVDDKLPAPHPHRCEPRRGVRRRRRSRVSAYVHGDGRRSEPRRTADGAVRTGGAGRNLCDGRRTRPLQHAVRYHPARAVCGEGQGGAGAGVVGRPRRRLAHAAGDAAAAAADRPQRRAGGHPQGVRERALGSRPPDRGRRRRRDRQDASARGAARRRSRVQQAARRLRGLHVVDPVCRLARAAARDARVRPGFARCRHRGANPRARWRSRRPISSRGCRCSLP